jgi:U3 small nucleolar RNA-associated protein 22
MKYWFDSHLISQVTEEFVELVTIHTFVSLQPWDPPSSLMSGFYRTLTLLSKWNWQQEPLILNMGGDLNSNDIKAIETRFSAWRNIDPAMKKVTMIIASDIDHDGVSWTLDNRPPKVVAGHVSRLAHVAVEALGKNPEELNLDNIFKPHLTPYHFLIHLDNKQNNKVNRPTTKYKNLELPGSSSSRSQNLGRLYVDELGTLFGNCALFFYSDEQRNIIAGLWKPESTLVKPFSLKAAYSSAPAGGDDQNPGVVLNKKAILNEMVRLGGSLVRSVDYGAP